MSEEYTAWANVPENLKTRTQLKAMGLRPARGQERAAVFCSYIRGRSRPTYYALYDVATAIPRRQPSPAQLATLEAAREKSLRLRTCSCGDVATPALYRRLHLKPEGQYVCGLCRDRRAAAKWAAGVLADQAAVILDTETTGLEYDDEVIEIAIVSTSGEVLFDRLVRPAGPVSAEATEVHGIGWLLLENAPAWPEVWPEIERILGGASRIVTYGVGFDSRLVKQTCGKYGIATPEWTWECAMEEYARWYGDWSDYHDDYKWKPLKGGHRALDDCLACLGVIKRMADQQKG